ncbi:MAG: N-acetyl-gamma-glutamyl-phosphate reductase [Gemmatimonadetes bacterium]|nr:N-acetyl-gamma-glutamyl-phosphate reductase [Gemmatimonadota bacterium]
MIRVGIVGGSGYTGGELTRLLLQHPGVRVTQVTSGRHAGKPVSSRHPNLRKVCQLDFVSAARLEPADVLFLCLPHGQAIEQIDRFAALAPRLIDLSADFRLEDPAGYPRWYGREHSRPDLLGRFVYGIPERHREAMRSATWVSSAGCNATATILALAPLYDAGLVEPQATVVEAKVGSSEGGAEFSEATHHPERAGCVRSYQPTGHRHVGEMIQELSNGQPISIHFSATAVEMVRGVLVTCHAFLRDDLDEREIWRTYRAAYGTEPFIRLVKARDGIHRLPEPKLVTGTNYCDIGFDRDPHSRRLVVVAAIDNLMKGAAGQAVQAFNLMHGFDETTGLGFPGLHPI